MSTVHSVMSKPDYGYIDHVVRTIRISANVVNQPTLPIEPGPLVSIHLQSNRPDNFPVFMENLVASLDDPSRIEVVLKIDNTDAPMNKLLPELVEKYRDIITLKFISTPLAGGFFELWRSMNDMLGVCHPHAYFLWNMNDEMAVLNKGWDTALAKYVGMFPDHIFRLRTSLFRSRNYYDYWECGFAPETSAITTKRWLDICGDWNPCLGPDSFNQCVAYYFGYHDRFYKHRVDRDIPVHDFIFAGEGAYIGMSGDALYRRARGASKAWFRLMSYEIQTEASRRAQRLMANIWAHREMPEGFAIEEDKKRQQFIVYDTEDHKAVHHFSYRLSKIRVKCSNLYRATAYYYYAGGGAVTPYSRFRQIIGFLSLRYDFCNNFRIRWIALRKTLRKTKSLLLRVLSSLRIIPVQWANIQASKTNNLRFRSLIFAIPKRIARVLVTKGFNRGIRFHPSVFAFDKISKAIDWDILRPILSKVSWPEYFTVSRVQEALLKCLLLAHWYEISTKQFVEVLGYDLAFQRFIGIPLNDSLPTRELIEEFKSLLAEANVEQTLYRKAELYFSRDDLPSVTFYGAQPSPAKVQKYEKYSA